jgi:uncharacterized membrane protein YccC
MDSNTKTPFEKFERKVTYQAFGTFILGGVIVYIVQTLTQDTKSLISLAVIAIWLALSFITSSRLRRRDETVIEYKKRIKYTEQNNE